jgi:Ca2+-binding RTX toxin-like protein
MTIINDTGTISGTVDNDIISDDQGGDSTITGNGGNDVIYADHDAAWIDTLSGNSAPISAIDIDGSASWSTMPNADVGNDSIPYTTIFGSGVLGSGAGDWFSVTIGAGETITIDIDYADTNGPDDLGGGDFDSYVRLYSGGLFGGPMVASDDDSGTGEGGLGSTSGFDSHLTYTATSSGTYYIEISQFVNDPIPLGGTYVANVSVTGHANTNVYNAGDDSVDGGGGDDRAYGFEGNDTLAGNVGSDTLLGGLGDDLLYGDIQGFSSFDNNDNELHGGAGNDTIVGGSAGDDQLFGDAGDDFLEVGFGADSAEGGDGDDRLIVANGLPGGRVLDGGAGRDILDLNEQSFDGTTIVSLVQGVLRGSGGTDTVSNIEDVYGNQGADVLNADTGNNELRGNNGDDVLRGFDGSDTLLGGLDNDTVLGGYGDDLMAGNDGDDSVNGQVGEDTINGGAGDDTLFGSFFDDTVNGGTGDDFIDGGSLDDILRGQDGNDEINGVTGNDTLFGGTGNDTLRGGAGIDQLEGGTGDDLIAGGIHSDTLIGGGGDDNLQGQGGLDRLEGGIGSDTLIGGDNADTFVFTQGDGLDQVNDFNDNQDMIELDSALWGGGLSGQDVIDTYAFANGNNTVLNFGADQLLLIGVTDPQTLVDDLITV